MARTAAERKAFKQQQRTVAAARKARERAERDRIEEARQEAIVPAASRKAVLTPSGAVLRAARITPDGPAFIRSSALAHLFRRNVGITAGHLVAAQHLLDAHDIAGEGVGMGASNYGERLGGGIAKSGISEGKHAALLRQTEAEAEVDAAKWFLGRSWRIVRGVVLAGCSLEVWAAAQNPPIYAKVVTKRLITALNRLVLFYRGPGAKATGKIRSAQVVARTEIPRKTVSFAEAALNRGEKTACEPRRDILLNGDTGVRGVSIDGFARGHRPATR